jgi:hypothetical protein
MIDMSLIVSCLEKIGNLINISRIERRDFLVNLLNPIYDDLRNIHHNYISTLSLYLNKFENNEISISDLLSSIKKERFAELNKRDELSTKCCRLLQKKWRPEVSAFLESIRDYFLVDIRNHDFYSLVDIQDIPKEDIDGFLEYKRALALSTGFCFITKQLLTLEKTDKYKRQFVLSLFNDVISSLRSKWDKIVSCYTDIVYKNKLIQLIQGK